MPRNHYGEVKHGLTLGDGWDLTEGNVPGELILWHTGKNWSRRLMGRVWQPGCLADDEYKTIALLEVRPAPTDEFVWRTGGRQRSMAVGTAPSLDNAILQIIAAHAGI